MLFVSISVNATIYGLEFQLEKAQCENKDLRSRNSTLEELLQQKSEKEEKMTSEFAEKLSLLENENTKLQEDLARVEAYLRQSQKDVDDLHKFTSDLTKVNT